tara:strand:- start:131 stop:388 length:258 start_codon:yes stop_codon:yes gene_type:complete
MERSIYSSPEKEMQIVKLGRRLITACEMGELHSGNDEDSLMLWNAAVTAGNKMTTIGLTYSRFHSVEDLTALEKRAVSIYLDGQE